jgi:hypothetical protein
VLNSDCPLIGASHDARPLSQRGSSGQMGDDLPNAVNHIRGRRLLSDLAIDFGHVRKRLRIGDQRGRRDAGTDRGELVE